MAKEAALPKDQRILLAAEQIFSRYGYAHATLDEIIRVADVGKGTVYKYFGNKEYLLYRLVCMKNEGFVERLRQAVAAGADFPDKLYRYFYEMADFYKKNVALWQIIFFEMLGDPNVKSIQREDGEYKVVSRYDVPLGEAVKERIVRYYMILEQESGVLRELITQGSEAGLLKGDEVEFIVRHMFFSTAMCIFHPCPVEDELTPEEGARIAVDRHLYGLARS